MEYNTDRPQLSIPEYGRNVHNMVSYCMGIEDKEHRNKVAQSIIDVMGNLNPHLRDVPDFKHKLWDHLFIMSSFKLDVDSPYPIPTADTFEEKPELVEYPQKSARYRHYGGIVRKMIAYAVQLEEGELKEGLKVAIANQMKKSYMLWNKDTVHDDVIFSELSDISGGKIQLSDIELSSHAQFRGQTQSQNNNQQRNRKHRTNNNNKKKKFVKK
jgi:hypothetical protein